MHPARDMNGNRPVMSWYMIPVFLSANAPKQNTFAMPSSITFGTVVLTSCLIFGVVLLIPYRGSFIHPFAVAGLGLRYFKISSSVIFGHPLRNPFRVAVNNLDILGLHSD